jgi:hypothetical protein
MTRERKDLLFKDLCARLPYNTKIQLTEYSDLTGEKLPSKIKILGYCMLGKVQAYCKGFRKDEVKPYLFPLSSMTKVQEDEWFEAFIDPLSKRLDRHTRQEDLQLQADAQAFGVEYLLKNHFDIYGLIPLDLAIDATDKNIY